MEKFRTKIFEFDRLDHADVEATNEAINEFLASGIEIRPNGFIVQEESIVICYYEKGTSHIYNTEDVIFLLEETLNTVITTKLLPAITALKNAEDAAAKKTGGKGTQESALAQLSLHEKNVEAHRKDIATQRAIIEELRAGTLTL